MDPNKTHNNFGLSQRDVIETVGKKKKKKKLLVHFDKENKDEIQPVNKLLWDRESRMLADNFFRNPDI